MQLPSDCLPALRFGPGPDDAKCTTGPGSADTAKSTVSGGPGSRDAKRARLGKRVERKKQAGSYELGNQTQFLASLSVQMQTKQKAVACGMPGRREPV